MVGDPPEVVGNSPEMAGETLGEKVDGFTVMAAALVSVDVNV